MIAVSTMTRIGVLCLLLAAMLLGLPACASEPSPRDAVLGVWQNESGSPTNDRLEFYRNNIFAWTMTEEGYDYAVGGEYALSDDGADLRLFPWGGGEARGTVSAPAEDTLVLDLTFPAAEPETLVLRKTGPVGKPVTKAIQDTIMGTTWTDISTPDGYVTHDFFEDGTLVIRLYQTAAPTDENYVWDHVTAGTYEFVGEDRLEIHIFGERVLAQVFLPTRDTYVIKTVDDAPYTVLRRLEEERPQPSDDPSRDIVGTWRADYGPDDFLQMEFFADGTIIRTQEFGQVEVGEMEFVADHQIQVTLPELEYSAEITLFPGNYLIHRLPYEDEPPVVFLWVE